MNDPVWTTWLARIVAILALTVVIALCLALVVWVWGLVF